MANWDFVFSYDSRATSWLVEMGLPHPPPRHGNRLPNTAEVVSVWRKHDPQRVLLVDDFVWDDGEFVPNDAFKMRGDRTIELRVLVELSSTCGQFWMFQDTGEPAVIVDALLDIERTLSLLEVASNKDNSWEHFYCEMYG